MIELIASYVSHWLEISNADLRAVSQILIKVPFVLAVATYQRVSRNVAHGRNLVSVEKSSPSLLAERQPDRQAHSCAR